MVRFNRTKIFENQAGKMVDFLDIGTEEGMLSAEHSVRCSIVSIAAPVRWLGVAVVVLMRASKRNPRRRHICGLYGLYGEFIYIICSICYMLSTYLHVSYS